MAGREEYEEFDRVVAETPQETFDVSYVMLVNCVLSDEDVVGMVQNAYEGAGYTVIRDWAEPDSSPVIFRVGPEPELLPSAGMQRIPVTENGQPQDPDLPWIMDTPGITVSTGRPAPRMTLPQWAWQNAVVTVHNLAYRLYRWTM